MSLMNNILRGAKSCFDNTLHGSVSTAKGVGKFLWDNARKAARETAKWIAKKMEKYYKKALDGPVKGMEAVINTVNNTSKEEEEQEK